VLNGFFLPPAEFGKYVDLGSHKTIVAVSRRSMTGFVRDGCAGVRFFRPNIYLMDRSAVVHPPLSSTYPPLWLTYPP
jgi:hypothetical protein